jgi:hypothetical protein
MTNEKTLQPASHPSSLRNYFVGSVVMSVVIGGIVGSLFSRVERGDLDFPKFPSPNIVLVSPIHLLLFASLDLSAGFYSMLPKLLALSALFGLPAGFLLGVIESLRGKRQWWVAVIELPSLIFGGIILIFAALSIPGGCYVVARAGSVWLTGVADVPILRTIIGALFGTCATLVLFGALNVVNSVQARWRLWISPRREET